jgi:hypothetical protein
MFLMTEGRRGLPTGKCEQKVMRERWCSLYDMHGWGETGLRSSDNVGVGSFALRLSCHGSPFSAGLTEFCIHGSVKKTRKTEEGI